MGVLSCVAFGDHGSLLLLKGNYGTSNRTIDVVATINTALYRNHHGMYKIDFRYLSSSSSSHALTYAHPPHESAPRYAGVNHRNMIRQFRFKDAVEVLAAADGAERVAVGELGEDANLVGVFELGAGRHYLLRSDQATL